MKSLLLVYCLSMIIQSATNLQHIPGDPIPGVNVKVGRKPPVGGSIMASATSNTSGQFEFSDLPSVGKIYFEYAIKDKGIRSNSDVVRSEDFEPVLWQDNATTRKVQAPPVVKNYGVFDVTYTFGNGKVKGRITYAKTK